MDTPSFNTTSSQSSQRRKLVKKPPSYHQYQHTAPSSTAFTSDAGFDDASSLSRRSSNSLSLSRAPSSSIPHVRSTQHSGGGASTASSPRHLPTIQRSNASPSLPQGEFDHLSLQDQGHYGIPLLQKNSSAGHYSRDASDDLIGAPFDGAAILNRLDASQSTSPNPAHHQQQHQDNYRHNNQSLQQPSVSTALANFSSEKQPQYQRLASPPLRATMSFNNMDSATEKEHGSRIGGRPVESFTNSKRLSDDGRDLKSAVRKKMGFSGFMNSLVGSNKKPVISAPENPVHVTHVGYDSTTGQFTVSVELHHAYHRKHALFALTPSRACQGNGND